MNALDLVLLRAGYTPAEIGLPDDEGYAPDAPRGLPTRQDRSHHSDRVNHSRVRRAAKPAAQAPLPHPPLNYRQAIESEWERRAIAEAEREAALRRIECEKA